MKVKGIIQGNTVKLSETVSVPDGTEVIVEIPDNPKMTESGGEVATPYPIEVLTEEQRKEKLKHFFAIPSQDTEELVAVSTELENERNEKIDSEIGIL